MRCDLTRASDLLPPQQHKRCVYGDEHGKNHCKNRLSRSEEGSRCDLEHDEAEESFCCLRERERGLGRHEEPPDNRDQHRSANPERKPGPAMPRLEAPVTGGNKGSKLEQEAQCQIGRFDRVQ